MNFLLGILFIVIAYFLGAIPVGYILVKKFTGKNILKLGSGNIGSTNVGRVTTKRLSIITQLLDMLKGSLPVGIYLYLSYNPDISYYTNIETNSFLIYIAIAAIIGHDFSIFLRFKGGKGVNTTLGASVLIAPISVCISVLIYFIIKWNFKYVSLGSISLALTLGICGFLIHGMSYITLYLIICMCLIIILHYENINRLFHHHEYKAKK